MSDSSPPAMPADSKPTYAVEVFIEMVRCFQSGVPMTPRSPNDKEYFAQDWFADRIREIRLPFLQQGRNSYPDFLVGAEPLVEGYELKSLAIVRGKPARVDIDFNSTIPSGQKRGRQIFLVFLLYTGQGEQERKVHTLSVAHADLINADHALADEHLNVAIRRFGSYADGFIRNRKMYVFPHPVSIDPESLGRARLVAPSSWAISDPRLVKLKTMERAIAPQAIESYTIRLRGRGEAEVHTTPYLNAGDALQFDIFEAAG